MNVIEIIKKEEERHQLVRLGMIPSMQDVIDMLHARCQHTALHDWDKNSILRYFYGTVVQYSAFIAREKTTNKTLKRVMFRKSSDLLLSFRKSETALIDREMKTGSQLTIAFHISDLIYELVYASFCRTPQTFENPNETCSFFSHELKRHYPLYIYKYVELLEQGDNSLWEVTCLYLQQLSYYVVSQYSGTFDTIGYLDIIRDETWSKAYEVLRRRIVEKEGNVPSFGSGKDFRNYMIKTCHYLAENLHKKYAKKEYALDDLLAGFQSDGEEEFTAEDDSLLFDIEAPAETEYIENDLQVLEIDIENPYEVAYTVSIILLNKEHALHRPLVHGMEDKVELLINKAVHDMSYRDIVAASYAGSPDDDDEFRRAVVKARKDYERTRKKLAERLLEIIAKKTVTFRNINRCIK